MTNINKKILVAAEPPFAHGDSAAAVVLEVAMLRIGAHLFDLGPANIFSCLSGGTGTVSKRAAVVAQTSTTAGVAGAKIMSKYFANISAFAAATPKRPFFECIFSIAPKHSQPTKTLAR
jgi:hypothetical protein